MFLSLEDVLWKGSRLFEIHHCSFEVLAGSREGLVAGNVNDGFFNDCNDCILNSFYSFRLVSNEEKLHLLFDKVCNFVFIIIVILVVIL